MPVTRLAPTIARVAAWAPVVVFAGLPTVGMVAGPSYSSMVIGLAVVWLAAGWGAGRGLPAIDRSFAALAGVFLLLCWASAAWSIAPRDSVRSALGLSGVFVALLVVSAGRHDRPWVAETVFRVLLVATVAGVGVACLDMALGYPLQMLISTKPGVSAATKYNRGFDYLVLIAWPLLAHVWWRRRWWAVCVLGLTTAVILAVTLSLAARVAVAAGLVVLMLAWVAPRGVAIALGGATVAYGLALPLALRLLATRRDELAPLVKASAQHRLEIWDYMTARVLERPVLGWGLLSAKSLPIHADELARYVYVRPAGVYPHNQFLELWVELGRWARCWGWCSLCWCCGGWAGCRWAFGRSPTPRLPRR